MAELLSATPVKTDGVSDSRRQTRDCLGNWTGVKISIQSEKIPARRTRRRKPVGAAVIRTPKLQISKLANSSRGVSRPGAEQKIV